MKTPAWMLLVVVAAFGCDRVDTGQNIKAPATVAADTAGQEKPTEVAQKPVQPVLQPKPNKAPAPTLAPGQTWAVSYVGDLEGTVGGDSVVVISSAIISNIRGGVAEGDAKQRFVLKIPANTGEATFDMNLADGTRCFDVTKQAPARSQAKVADSTPDNFEAQIQGELWCGDQKEKNIQYKALLKK